MARHRLDLLPLLDVFMVVLFVFATIQEQRLDDSVRHTERLRASVDQAEQAFVAALAREEGLQDRVDEAERALDVERAKAEAHAKIQEIEHEAEIQEKTDTVAAAELKVERLNEELVESAERLAELVDNTRKALVQTGSSDEQVRRADVLDKLLDSYSVFEIEIAGEQTAGGTVVNRCCFRVDPFAEGWHRCGRVPAEAEARAEWIADGAGGLEAALRRTKGGNAMTLVRQDSLATYRIGASLEEDLRDRFPDHQIYDDGVVRDRGALRGLKRARPYSQARSPTSGPPSDTFSTCVWSYPANSSTRR